MQIKLVDPDRPYECKIDPGVMPVTITEAFNPITLETADGEKLHICMRDSGFEVIYEVGEHIGHFGFNNGHAAYLSIEDEEDTSEEVEQVDSPLNDTESKE